MKLFLMRLVGIALVAAGIAGLIFSVAGIFVLVEVEKRIEPVLMARVDQLDRALVATVEGLALADDTLGQASTLAGGLVSAVDGVNAAISGTVPTVDAVAKVLGEQLPATVDATQKTLATLAATAKGVDDFLVAVTSIPFLGGAGYNPEVPLHRGVGDVAASLDQIPAALDTAQQGLTATSNGLEGLQAEMTSMADDVQGIVGTLQDAEAVIDEYQVLLDDMQDMVSKAQVGLPQWLTYIRWGLTFVLIWLGVAQLGLITQGVEVIGRSRNRDGAPDTVSADETAAGESDDLSDIFS
jgi:hypothetical protein